MALNVGRWIKYAQAKLDQSTRSGHQELDDLEAERAAEVADRPWLTSDRDAPTFDEAKARIEWEAEEQRRLDVADAERADPHAPAPGRVDAADAADIAGARLELERRQQEATRRLDAMRAELGVDPPPPGDTT